jgi:hypothetical protein
VWKYLLIAALVAYVLLSRPRPGSRAGAGGVLTAAEYEYERQLRATDIYEPPGNGNAASSTNPLKRGCEKVFHYNDPGTYAGGLKADQRVQAVSQANNALQKINCGAIGYVEDAWEEFKSWF